MDVIIPKQEKWKPHGSILVTGGTGTLGRAILRRAFAEDWDAHITIMSRDEMKQQVLKPLFPGIRWVVGDVCDYDTLEKVMCGHDTVIHAAAFKHIPAGEMNPETVMNVNYVGSRHVAYAAMRCNVKQVLGISTDKACEPINIYGASKMAMERVWWSCDGVTNTHFTCVRYGNVLGSTGSVLPRWDAELKDRGFITVTNPTMTRFWMTSDQAVDVILRALENDNGAVRVPMLGSCSIEEFARWSYPDGVEFKVVGTRPGEKPHETLVSRLEAHRSSREDDDLIVRPPERHYAEPCEEVPWTSDSARARAKISREILQSMLREEGLR